MYVYVYICIPIYVNIYIGLTPNLECLMPQQPAFARIRVDIYTYIHIYTYTYTYVYICIYMYTYICKYIYIGLTPNLGCPKPQKSVCARVRVPIYAYT